MAAHAIEDEGGLRRTLAIGAACALLTLFFFALRFPYDRFRTALVEVLASATGAEVTVGALSGGVGLGGLHVVAAPVTLRWPTGAKVDLTRAAVRPGWSLSWLRARPAIHLDFTAPAGELVGTLWPSDPLTFEGQLRGVALDQLPPELMAGAEGFALSGKLDADADLRVKDGAFGGDLDLDVRDGSFAAPGAPVSIPFERLQAEVGVGAQGDVQVQSASLHGPMIEGSAQGHIGAPSNPTLDLEVDLHVTDRSLQGAFTPLGIRLDPAGKAKLHVQGTLDAPIIR